MRHQAKSFHAVQGLAVVLLLAGSADAQIVDWVEAVDIQQESFHSAVLSVSANAQDWVEIDDATAELRLRATGSCKGTSKVGVSDIYLHRPGKVERVFSYFNTGLEDRIHSWDHLEVENVALTVGEAQQVVASCQAEKERLLGQGNSLYEVLSQGHVIQGPALFQARHYFGCDGHLLNADLETAGPKPVTTRVLCQASTEVPAPLPPGPGGLAQTFGVTRAEVDVTPDHASVLIKADLTVDGAIEVNGPGRVRYRLVHNGDPSDVATLSFSQAKTWEHAWPLVVRCDQPQQSSSGGGIGGLVGAPPNVRTGTVRIEILEPTSGVRVSEEAPYSVTCRETGELTAGQPDLTIADVKASEATANAVARVRNRGTGGAPPSQLAASRAGAAPTQVPLPAVGAGQEVEVEIPLPAVVGGTATPVTFVVDPDDTVQESDEGNNEYVP
jgi:hypothetical protein